MTDATAQPEAHGLKPIEDGPESLAAEPSDMAWGQKVSNLTLENAGLRHNLTEQALVIDSLQEIIQKRTQEVYDATIAMKRAQADLKKYEPDNA